MARQFSVTNKGTKSEFFRLSVSKPSTSQQIHDDYDDENNRAHYVNGAKYQDESAVPVLSEDILMNLIEDERERKMEEQ